MYQLLRKHRKHISISYFVRANIYLLIYICLNGVYRIAEKDQKQIARKNRNAFIQMARHLNFAA